MKHEDLISTLFIFDFDDTLVRSGAQAHFVKDGKNMSLESHQINSDTFIGVDLEDVDFSEFDDYPPSPVIIDIAYQKFVSSLKLDYAEVIILSGRGISTPIREFCNNHGANGNYEIYTLSDHTSQGKYEFVKNYLTTKSFAKVIVYENDRDHIREIEKACEEFKVSCESFLI